MAELVADCPRCGSRRITFDALAVQIVGIAHRWKATYETFCVCRHCQRTTIFVLSDSLNSDHDHTHKVGLLKVDGSLNRHVDVERHTSLRDAVAAKPPEHCPKDIDAAFKEGATCLTVGCPNAAGTMFRLCIDHATRPLVPEPEAGGPVNKIRRSLGLRLEWLFDNKLLPEALRELSTAVKEDGNDGAHAGTLTEPEANDLLDFTTALLERMFTEPERLRLAKVRRDERRAKPNEPE